MLGLRFLEAKRAASMTLHHISARYDIAAQEDRSAPRTKIVIPAQLRASGSRPFQTVVNDLSLSGFSATAISRMHVVALASVVEALAPGLERLGIIEREGFLVLPRQPARFGEGAELAGLD